MHFLNLVKMSQGNSTTAALCINNRSTFHLLPPLKLYSLILTLNSEKEQRILTERVTQVNNLLG
jgi:hypothetical protein